MKKKILFVGEHPFSHTGNAHMMTELLSSIDTEKYEIVCFAVNEINHWELNIFKTIPFSILPARMGSDWWGKEKLLDVIKTVSFDILLMVGIDIWRYSSIMDQIAGVRNQKGFKWVWIAPYDLHNKRSDWFSWFNMLDYPCVYSRYGYEMLKNDVPGVRYFRPPLCFSDEFRSFEKEERHNARRECFKGLDNDKFLLGFVGGNMIRKDLPTLIKAFLEAKKTNQNLVLYLHTQTEGAYHFIQMFRDWGGKTGDLVIKAADTYSIKRMVEVYNGLDCLVNCTMQEGLSWTPLEAMLCGTPVIASRSTAHPELLGGAGLLVPCTRNTMVPLMTSGGPSHVESKRCSVDDVSEAIISVASSASRRDEMSISGIKKAKEWLAGTSDINDLLHEATFEKIAVLSEKKKNKILFVQHSSAGDVLMTTQCFKGIKERHPGLELCYMTQSQFIGIIEGNPYVDELVSWDIEEVKRYEIVYNPHGEHILRGGFNALDVKLYSMYPYFCKVEPDEIFIDPVKPDIELPEDYVVVQTTGGDAAYRTYPHMDLVLKGLDLPAIQLGAKRDRVACLATDLRGKTSFRESAWIVAHAKGAMVIDSFMSHLCGALGTPVVVLYGPSPARVVGPRVQRKGGYISMEPAMLDVCKSMTRCWGARNRMGVDKCISPCLHTINPLSVRKAFLSFWPKKVEG